MKKQYITPTDAAEVLGITRGRVHQLLREKCPACNGEGCKRCEGTGHRLPATRFGHAWMIHRRWDITRLRNHLTDDALMDEDAVRRWNGEAES